MGALDNFIDQLVDETAVTGRVDPATLSQLKLELSGRLENFLNRRLIEAMDEDAVTRFNDLLDGDPSAQEVQAFVEAHVPDREAKAAEALLEFRSLYLGDQADRGEPSTPRRYAKVAPHGTFIVDLKNGTDGVFEEYNSAAPDDVWQGTLSTGTEGSLAFVVGDYRLEVTPQADAGHLAGTESGPHGETWFDVYELSTEGSLPGRPPTSTRWLLCTPDGTEVVNLDSMLTDVNYPKVFLATLQLPSGPVHIRRDSHRRCLTSSTGSPPAVSIYQLARP